MANAALRTFGENLKKAPGSIKESMMRHGWPIRSDRDKSQAIFQNFFLHIQSARTHKWTLRPSFTMGLGLVSFFLFLLLTATGVLLMMYYTPSTERAYDNVRDISFVVSTGKYMRNIHRWGAHAMVAVVLLHMARVFFTGSYKRARKFNWLIGMVLLVLTLLLSYTGYLLPWDQLAYWAVTIGANIAGSPSELTDAVGMTSWFDVGGLMKKIIIGGETVGQEALTRFYLMHVMILPIAMITLVGVHFWRIRKDGGMSRPDNADEILAREEGIAAPVVAMEDAGSTAALDTNKTYGLMALIRDRSPAADRRPDNTVMTWPTTLWAEVAVLMLTMAVMLGVAYLVDAPLKELANPSIPENPAKAPWYFLGLQELVSYSAFMGGIGIPTVVLVGLMMVPYLDKEEEHFGVWFSGAQGKRVALFSSIFAAVFLVALLTFTVKVGWLRDWFPDLKQIVIVFANPGSLIVLAFAWWSLHTLRRTRSTRMAAIALFSCFLVGFLILTVVGTYFRGPNWDFFWSRAQWPIH